MLTCFSGAPPGDHALGAAAERLIGQTGRLHKACFLCTVRAVCDFKPEQGYKCRKDKILFKKRDKILVFSKDMESRQLYFSLTNIIIKSKGTLVVVLVHDGLLNGNNLIVCFIFFDVHSSQRHLHFHSVFSGRENQQNKFQGDFFPQNPDQIIGSLHAVCSSQHPAGLNEDAPTDVAEGPGRAPRPGLQGSLPRVSPGERLLPPKDPGRASGLWPPALGELGSSDVLLCRRQICLVDGRWGGWSWEGWIIKKKKKLKMST